MATAEKKTETTTTTTINLVLTEEEALYLKKVCQRTGGTGRGRKVFQAVGEALYTAGVKWAEDHATGYPTGEIRFDNDPEPKRYATGGLISNPSPITFASLHTSRP